MREELLDFQEEIANLIALPCLHFHNNQHALQLRYTHPGLNPERFYIGLRIIPANNGIQTQLISYIHEITWSSHIIEIKQNTTSSAIAQRFKESVDRYPCIGLNHRLDIILEHIRSRDVLLSLLPRIFMCGGCPLSYYHQILAAAERTGIDTETLQRIRTACNVAK
jgi:hypothetical protein